MAMTKKHLIAQLADFADDARVSVAFVHAGDTVVEDLDWQVVDNGGPQLSTVSMQELAEQGYAEIQAERKARGHRAD